MKKWFFLLTWLVLSNVIHAQGVFQDVVYLKNGSIVRGVIIEQVQGHALKIKTAAGNVFSYQESEVLKITKEAPPKVVENQVGGLKRGYKGIVKAGYAFGFGNDGFDRLKIGYLAAYQFNPFVSLGAGTGLDYFPKLSVVTVPFYADLRANLLKGPMSPFLALGFGYSFDASHNFSGTGTLANLQIGLSTKMSGGQTLHFGVGIEVQDFDFRTSIYGSELYASKAFSAEVGISF